MRRFRLLVVGILVLVMGAVAGLWVLVPRGPQKVTWPGGGEMHVLKVSLGTNHTLSFEPQWKQLARRLMPSVSQSVWGAFTGERAQTRYEAMVLWLDGPGISDGKGLLIDKAEAVFTNAFIPGTVNAKPGIVRLTFPCFARDQKQVPLRVWQGTNMVEFQVANSRPVKAASWTALPVPQTQAVSRAQVIFNGLSDAKTWKLLKYKPVLQVRAPEPSRVGFMAWWHVTAFDRWGNYSQPDSGYSRYEVPSFPSLPPGRGPWRVLVEGEEYLSAGYFPPPTNRLVVVVSPTPRMQDLGIRFLMMVGPGAYMITNGRIASAEGPPTRTSSAEAWGQGNAGIEMTNRLVTWVPGIFCLSEVQDGVPAPRMRIHMRDARSEGPTTPARSILSWSYSLGNTKHRVQFFKAPMPSVSTGRYEVELIFALTTDFFVEPPDKY